LGDRIAVTRPAQGVLSELSNSRGIRSAGVLLFAAWTSLQSDPELARRAACRVNLQRSGFAVTRCPRLAATSIPWRLARSGEVGRDAEGWAGPW